MKHANLWILIATALLWGSAYPAIRYVVASLDGGVLTIWRLLLAALLALAIAKFRRPPLPRLKDVPLLTAVGFLGFSVYQALIIHGAKSATSAEIAVMLATTPVWTGLFARLVFKRKLKKNEVVGFAISLVGVAITQAAPSFSFGAWWVLLAAVLAGFTFTIEKNLIETYGPFRTLLYALTLGTLPAWFLLPGTIESIDAITAPVALLIFYLAWIPLLLGWSLKFIALSRMSASHATQVLLLVPISGAFFGWIFLGEVIGLRYLIGSAIVLFGISVTTRDRSHVPITDVELAN